MDTKVTMTRETLLSMICSFDCMLEDLKDPECNHFKLYNDVSEIVNLLKRELSMKKEK